MSNSILFNKELSPLEKVILNLLCVYKEKNIPVTYTGLMEALSVSKNTVIRALKSLSEKGYIEIIKRQAETGVTVNNEYKINYDKIEKGNS